MSRAPSARTAELVEIGQRTYVPNYAPKPIILERGSGSRVWDLDGNEYLDLGTGISVNSFGHQHPELVRALMGQAEKIWHASNLYYTEPTVRLAQALVEGSFAERVFFCNSGAEAIEAAIKLVRRHASLGHPPEKREIVTFEGSFHGRTLAAVTATAQPKYQEGFEPLPGGFVYCPFNDFEAAERAVGERTCAVLVEPVQGEGGITPARQGFLAHLRALCDRHDALLVFDEIQSGMGRTGKLFAYQWESGVEPDVATMAKALGGGLPIGAMLVGPRAAETLAVGSHGSTFGGNPVVAAVARVAFRLAGSPEILANVARQGEAFRAFLTRLDGELGVFSDIRARGLMIGAELADPRRGQAGALTDRCAEHGVLVLQAGPDVLRLLPPLVITDEETAEATARMERAIREWAGQEGGG